MMSGQLKHHGILGMRWGVRRSPEQLGHRKSSGFDRYYARKHDSASYQKKLPPAYKRGTEFVEVSDTEPVDHEADSHPVIKAGTNFSRVSINESDLSSGRPLYVSYKYNDINYWASPYGVSYVSSGAWKHDDSEHTYQQKLVLKKDLNVASYKEVEQLSKDIVRNDQKAKRELAKATLEKYAKDCCFDSANDKIAEEIGYESYKDFTHFVKSHPEKKKALQKAFNTHMTKAIDYEVDQLNKSLESDGPTRTGYSGSGSLKTLGKTQASNLGASPYLKSCVQKALRERGYNACVDVAGVDAPRQAALGGVSYGSEDGDPLIVFDSSVFEQVGSKKLY